MSDQYSINKSGNLVFTDKDNKTRKVYNKKGKPSNELKKNLISGFLKSVPDDFNYILDVSVEDNKRFIKKDKIFKNKGRSDKIKVKYINSNLNITKQGLYKIKKIRNKLQPTEKKAMKSGVRTIQYRNTNNKKGLSFLNDLGIFTNQLRNALKIDKQKVIFKARIKYRKIDGTEEFRTISTESINILNFKDIKSTLKQVKQDLEDQVDHVKLKGSGWMVVNIAEFQMDSMEYKPLKGKSYIELPKWIANKKACINPKNPNDDMCFKWAVITSLNSNVKDIQRLTVIKKLEKQLPQNICDAFSALTYPVKCDSNTISKFEKTSGLSINVYMVDKMTICPLYISKVDKGDDKNIDLLLITKPNKSHYVCIKNLSRLLARQAGYKEKSNNKVHICRNCLHPFKNEETLIKHRENGCASINGDVRVEMPKPKENILKFKNYQNKFKVPFVIYADFESILKPRESINTDKKSHIVNDHVPCGFTLKPVSINKKLHFSDVTYRGEDCIKIFCEELKKLEEEICKEHLQRYKSVDDMHISPQQNREFLCSKTCSICEEEFKLNDIKVRDHCHVTGHYRGAAHQSCNVNANLKNFKVPVVFHNLKGYDSHFIISELDESNTSYIKKGKDGEETIVTPKITVIAENSERLITFSYKRLKFIDSMSFLSSSLSTLTKNMYDKGKGVDLFIETRKAFDNDKHFDLLMRKGVYPYSYMNSFDRFKETKLPNKKHFYNDFTEEHISDGDYTHAKNVWNTFNIKNMGEYHDLYMKSDVYLLTDIFENFRNISMQSYNLDPVHYLSLPGYSWDCMMYKTKVELSLLTDIDQHLFVEKGIRGGVSMIMNRHAKSNNPYLSSYDKDKQNNYIMYWDANNLYGLAMVDYLPTESLGFLNESEITDMYNSIHNEDIDERFCHILEVDLEYPEHLHDTHNDLPVAPERMCVGDDMLSNYQKDLAQKLDVSTSSKVEKLVPNLMNKTKYIVHERNLKYYLKLGLKLTKIHRVLKCKQSRWLKDYIELNTEFRKHAKNDFEKDFYKLMNNAVFGKTMENVRGRIDLELVCDKPRAMKLQSDPRLKNVRIIREQKHDDDNGLVSYERRKNLVKLNKPIFTGFAILELSKLHMYKFHYDFVKNKYGNKAKLLFTDTDSLCYDIRTDDIYKDIQKDKSQFDLSNYTNEYKDNTNKKVLGMFKDETAGVPIKEFIGIKSKMYSLLIDNNNEEMTEKKTGKGIKKYKLKNDHIKHSDYKRCIFHNNIKSNMLQTTTFQGIQTRNHKVTTANYTKTSLNCYDDKSYIIDGIKMLRFGHKDIN